MLAVLLEAAVRGGTLLAVVWVLLRALRLRDPAVEKDAWTLIVAAALLMPLLTWMAGAVAPPLRMLPLKLLPSPPLASAAAVTGMVPAEPGSRIELACAFIYVVGTAALLTRFLTGLWIGVRLRRHASKVLGLHLGSIDIRVSAAIRSPASFASTILLPPAYETWDSRTLATVLAHEQAHIRNLDGCRLWLTALYRAVFWFDPLAHWLHWRLRALSELTSDEAAVAAAGDRVIYAATLKQLASPSAYIPSTVAMADSPSLGRRLRRLLSERGFGPPLARRWRALLMSAVLVTIVLAALPQAGAMVPVKQRPATLEFLLVDEQNNPVLAHHDSEVPAGDKLYKERDGTPVLLKGDAVARGDEVTHVVVATTPQGPAVNVRLDARGAASMLKATRQNLGHRLATVYKGQVINDAVILGVFGRQFQVTGLTAAQAHDLAMQFGRATK
jgi:beta-lactamase regulating signal transducer with metallopeptidase domain